MKLLLASGLTAAMLTGSAGAYALVAGVPDRVDLPEQAQVPEVELPESDLPEAPELPELPELPEVPQVENEASEDADEAEPASALGAERQAAAMDFVALMQEWSTCVGEAAETHEDSAAPFSPDAACGEKPAPPVPAPAADRMPSPVPPAGTRGSAGDDLPVEGEAGRDLAEEKAAEGQSRAEGGPGNAPADLPGGRP